MRLTSEVRSQFAQLSTSKSLEGLVDVLAQVVPQLGYLNGSDGETGAANWVSARVEEGTIPSAGLSISNPKARPGTAFGLPVSGDVNHFSVQTRVNAFRLRKPDEDDAAYAAAIHPIQGHMNSTGFETLKSAPDR